LIGVTQTIHGGHWPLSYTSWDIGKKIYGRSECSKLHLFESTIDLLSYCTLELYSGRDWRKDNCLSLAEMYTPKKDVEDSRLPAALTQYLKDFPKINEIALHLDNDTAERMAANTIKTILPPAIPFVMSRQSVGRIVTII